MLNYSIMVGIGAGISAAVAHSSLAVPGLAGIILAFAAPLPLFLAGLGWGWRSALAGALVGSLAVAVSLGLAKALSFAFTTAIAPVVVARLALINRPVARGSDGEGEAVSAGIEWYPEGRLLLWLCGIVVAVSVGALFVLAGDLAALRAELANRAEMLLREFFQHAQPEAQEQIKPMAQLFSIAAPIIWTCGWTTVLFINMRLAERILDISQWSPRPWPAFSKLTFPKSAGLLLAAAAASTLLPGTAGYAGWHAAAGLGTAFAIKGLSVAHSLVADNPARGLILATLYTALFFFGWVLVLPLMVLALIEMIFGLRSRANPGRGGPKV